MYVCIHAYMQACLHVCMYVCVCMYICLYSSLTAYPSVYLSTHPSVSLSIYLSIHPSIYRSIYTSIDLSPLTTTYSAAFVLRLGASKPRLHCSRSSASRLIGFGYSLYTGIIILPKKGVTHIRLVRETINGVTSQAMNSYQC